jgi:hypothetical protein
MIAYGLKGQKQLAFSPSLLILANNSLPLNEVLYF